MSGPGGNTLSLRVADRKQQMQSEKRAGLGRFVVEEVGWSPLIGESEVKSAVAICVRCRDAAAHHWFLQANQRADVVIAPVVAVHKKRIEIVAAEVGAGLEIRPELWVVHDLIVAGAKGLEFGPAVDGALEKSHGLDHFEHAIVVEVRQLRVPTPAAARQAELFGGGDIRRNAVLHGGKVSGALPKEVAFGEAELRGDVADVNVEQ